MRLWLRLCDPDGGATTTKRKTAGLSLGLPPVYVGVDLLGFFAAVAFGNQSVRLLWFLWSTVVYVLTIQLVDGRKPWAREVLMVLMFPIGTMLLSKRQLGLYMRQES